MTKSISELALATIEELKRRGWTQGTLGKTVDFDEELGDYRDISEEDCKVCLLGGMSSAYNPYHPFEPGENIAGYTVEGGVSSYKDDDYQRFVEAVADEIRKSNPSLVGAFGSYGMRPHNTIPLFNDASGRTVDEVIKLLKRVAKKHAS